MSQMVRASKGVVSRHQTSSSTLWLQNATISSWKLISSISMRTLMSKDIWRQLKRIRTWHQFHQTNRATRSSKKRPNLCMKAQAQTRTTTTMTSLLIPRLWSPKLRTLRTRLLVLLGILINYLTKGFMIPRWDNKLRDRWNTISKWMLPLPRMISANTWWIPRHLLLKT